MVLRSKVSVPAGDFTRFPPLGPHSTKGSASLIPYPLVHVTVICYKNKVNNLLIILDILNPHIVLQTNINVVNAEAENMKKLENYLSFAIKRKLQEVEASNVLEHSSKKYQKK